MLKNLIDSLPVGVKPALGASMVLAAVCAAPLAQAQATVSRIGFVYTERLMTDSKMAKSADAKLAAEFSKRQKAVEEMVGKYKEASEKFDAEAPGLTELERPRRARELYNMQKDVERMQREFQEDLQQRKNEERAAIAQKAYKLVEQVAEQEKLDAVLVEAAWVSPRVDITDKILKLLDK
ncbi:OmpH family outer membrane protein [Telluria beijingensis]|uniref:OmpH family outer membrane protein n=1 Tax=Telluria beijingensis TaxID=3068633 RepID=UPI002795B8AC|nr:OmpH family outer membrane protein [Massilia sp. REN29]